MSLLEARGIVAGYGAAEQILKGAALRVEQGEIVTIIGPNGAGKSTLLKVVAGLVGIAEGRITLDGADITPADAIGRARAGLAFMPQERNVFGAMTVAENLDVSGFLDPRGTKRRAELMYARYPVLAAKRQILGLAMALMTEPRLLLLDEPSAGLSPKAADELFAAIVDLNRAGLAILMVEQHALEALAISTRGYLLIAGRNGAEGPGPALADDPEIRRLFLGGS